MMVGNRGETRATFDETLRFLERAKPHQYIFAALSVYPGTRDFDLACEAGWLDGEFYFERDFQELKTTFDASDEDTDVLPRLVPAEQGPPRAVARGRRRVPRHPRAPRRPSRRRTWTSPARSTATGRLDEAERHARRALELGYPLPGLALNYLACIAARRGDLDGDEGALRRGRRGAIRSTGCSRTTSARSSAGTSAGLVAKHEFQLLERAAQPTLPGPLADDFAVWSPPPPPPERPIGSVRSHDARKLRVVSA